MPDPIVFISHSTIKEGHVDAVRELSREVFPRLEADKPDTVFHYGYIDEGANEIHFVHVFPDPAAMDAHMEGVAERVRAAQEHIETRAYEVYGRPSEALLSALRQSPSAEATIVPDVVGGYIRLGRGTS